MSDLRLSVIFVLDHTRSMHSATRKFRQRGHERVSCDDPILHIVLVHTERNYTPTGNPEKQVRKKSVRLSTWF